MWARLICPRIGSHDGLHWAFGLGCVSTARGCRAQLFVRGKLVRLCRGTKNRSDLARHAPSSRAATWYRLCEAKQRTLPRAVAVRNRYPTLKNAEYLWIGEQLFASAGRYSKELAIGLIPCRGATTCRCNLSDAYPVSVHWIPHILCSGKDGQSDFSRRLHVQTNNLSNWYTVDLLGNGFQA
jgi:hypothetical protein